MPPYGRGGAGNIQTIEQENAKVAADLEANQSSAEKYTTEQLPPKREEQQYKRTGRGGAGNMVDSNVSKKDDLVGSGPTPKPVGATGPARYGRGGAGNHDYSDGIWRSENARKTEKEHASREKLQQAIEKGVEESLAMPQKARLVGR
ncbi:hypothetical protein LTR09_003451 [Extremus antarcticus]|uniref:Uncharacterized protein n=1 Tax=Extremus antarcticus TaxID=702011 RepID=A0AAJ0DJX1_9PEZI|nr:hypothetical protein LTR09_003451 [Extremus antarcticus]